MTELPLETAGPLASESNSGLVRRLGLFDTTMIVMGGIIGASIFVLPAVVARQVSEPLAILGTWVVGGILSLFGAFIQAELSVRFPRAGGQYVYLREAYHPAIAFLYGWTLLLVTQTGAIASVAVIFARHFLAITHLPLAQAAVTTIGISIVSMINCFGVRLGSTVQNTLMTLKIITFLSLILCGLLLPIETHPIFSLAFKEPPSLDLLTAMGGAIMLVLFSYGGSQRIGFIAGEVSNPARNLPGGIVMGLGGVMTVYLLVNYVCLRVLGTNALARTRTPASEVMHHAVSERGELLIGVGVIISAVGWLSQVTLTAPRVYFAMARDNLFFKIVAWIHPGSRVPVIAILLQGFCAIIIAFSGKYEQILGYVMSADLIFFALAAASVFHFRRRDACAADPGKTNADHVGFKVPGHPYTTTVVIIVAIAVSLGQFYRSPVNSIIGVSIVLAGLPVYKCWQSRR